MREVATMPGIGEVISVRSAKAHLSALLDLVAGGREITITSDGKPKAKLVTRRHQTTQGFSGHGRLPEKQPIQRRACQPMKSSAPTVTRGAGEMYLDSGHHREVASARSGQRMVWTALVRAQL